MKSTQITGATINNTNINNRIIALVPTCYIVVLEVTVFFMTVIVSKDIIIKQLHLVLNLACCFHMKIEGSISDRADIWTL